MKKVIKYESENSTAIWTYDLDKFKNGPVSVEIIEKNPEPIKRNKK
jgi:hypothetical protein